MHFLAVCGVVVLAADDLPPASAVKWSSNIAKLMASFKRKQAKEEQHPTPVPTFDYATQKEMQALLMSDEEKERAEHKAKQLDNKYGMYVGDSLPTPLPTKMPTVPHLTLEEGIKHGNMLNYLGLSPEDQTTLRHALSRYTYDRSTATFVVLRAGLFSGQRSNLKIFLICQEPISSLQFNVIRKNPLYDPLHRPGMEWNPLTSVEWMPQPSIEAKDGLLTKEHFRIKRYKSGLIYSSQTNEPLPASPSGDLLIELELPQQHKAYQRKCSNFCRVKTKPTPFPTQHPATAAFRAQHPELDALAPAPAPAPPPGECIASCVKAMDEALVCLRNIVLHSPTAPNLQTRLICWQPSTDAPTPSPTPAPTLGPTALTPRDMHMIREALRTNTPISLVMSNPTKLGEMSAKESNSVMTLLSSKTLSPTAYPTTPAPTQAPTAPTKVPTQSPTCTPTPPTMRPTNLHQQIVAFKQGLILHHSISDNPTPSPTLTPTRTPTWNF